MIYIAIDNLSSHNTDRIYRLVSDDEQEAETLALALSIMLKYLPNRRDKLERYFHILTNCVTDYFKERKRTGQ